MDDATRCFPARFDHLPQALDCVSRAGADAGFTPDQCKRIELVIEELFSNTLHHGHLPASCAGAEHSIRLAIHATSCGLEIVYEDTASAFDPTAGFATNTEERVSRHEIGGLGRNLLNAMPNSVKYVREDGRNRLVLRFDR